MTRPPRSLWRDAWSRLIRNKAAVAGAIVILFFMFVALFAPVLAPHNPLELNSGKGFLPPMWVERSATGKAGTPEFILGTDNLGRDVLSRVIYGARVSMVVGFIPTMIIVVVGVSLGLVAGYWGGSTDNLLMRLTDIVYAFPDLLFFIIVMTALRATAIGQFLNGLFLLFVALALVNWVGVARLVRGQVLALKERDFVLASRAVGVNAHAHHVPPHFAQLAGRHHRGDGFSHPRRHHHRGDPGLSGTGSAPFHRPRRHLHHQLGVDAARRPDRHQQPAVDSAGAGDCGGVGRALLQLPR
jgi:ABC-type dipeptide/oligopeptide/nickel transport system permease subunit